MVKAPRTNPAVSLWEIRGPLDVVFDEPEDDDVALVPWGGRLCTTWMTLPLTSKGAGRENIWLNFLVF